MLSTRLSDLIGQLDYVQDFQKAELVLRADRKLWDDYKKMTELQQEAILFRQIGKAQAYKETSAEAQKIEKNLKLNLKVQDYLDKMEDVNDLLDYVTGEIEKKVNEKL
ncbi:MAG: YlbF family regulator [Streptococcaceae bacterium]|jgi:cell fate (sporulation/competence/biofilm development) regulator YmcA (YheA/YmcA/DUF963 family)|nr:YlbF family regulator [Streptococcaceae bacterium]